MSLVGAGAGGVGSSGPGAGAGAGIGGGGGSGAPGALLLPPSGSPGAVQPGVVSLSRPDTYMPHMTALLGLLTRKPLVGLLPAVANFANVTAQEALSDAAGSIGTARGGGSVCVCKLVRLLEVSNLDWFHQSHCTLPCITIIRSRDERTLSSHPWCVYPAAPDSRYASHSTPAAPPSTYTLMWLFPAGTGAALVSGSLLGVLLAFGPSPAELPEPPVGTPTDPRTSALEVGLAPGVAEALRGHLHNYRQVSRACPRPCSRVIFAAHKLGPLFVFSVICS
jgi:hypothetical protein